MDFAIGRIHQRKPAWNLKSYPIGYQIKSASPSEWRITDQHVESKKILLHPSKHAKHELSKTTSPTQNSQRHLFPEIITPSRRKTKKKSWASLSENLAGWGAVFPRPGDKLSLHLMVQQIGVMLGTKRCGLPTPSGKKQRLHEDCGFTMLERKRGSKKFKASARPGVIGGDLVAQLLHET